jgi:glycosyltransferase involved in cell wall biosynthesis
VKILQLGMGWFDELPGGLDRFYAGLLPSLARSGDQIQGLVAGSERVQALSAGLARSATPLTSSLPARLLGFRREVKRTLSQFQPDVVAAHFALFARPALDLVRCPLVFHFHGPWAAEGRAEKDGSFATFAKRQLIELPVLRRADRLVVLSKAFADILVRDYQIPASRIEIVPGGFHPDPFTNAPPREQARIELSWPTDRRIILCVRRLRHRMGLENLVQAVAELRAAHPEILLLIAGKGPLQKTLQERIDADGLAEHVRLLGFVPDDLLPTCYAAADFSAVPTVALEGFGLIVAESLAAGTPVVATPVGALPEILQERFPSLVCRDATAAGIRERIDHLLRTPSDLPSAQECRAHAARYTWDAVTPRLREVYRHVHDGRGK